MALVVTKSVSGADQTTSRKFPALSAGEVRPVQAAPSGEVMICVPEALVGLTPVAASSPRLGDHASPFQTISLGELPGAECIVQVIVSVLVMIRFVSASVPEIC